MLAKSVSGEYPILAAGSTGSNTHLKIGLLNLSETVYFMF